MKPHRVLALFLMALGLTLLLGCKGGALKLTTEGKESSLEPSSAIIVGTTKTFSEPDGKGGFKQGKASSHYLYLMNFMPKADVKNLENKTVPGAQGNVRVSMSLVGKEGTEAGGLGAAKGALGVGTYGAKVEKFQKAEGISITVVADGKPKEISFDRDKTEGSVKITSVDADTVAGEIDLRDGKNAISGSFKTKLQQP